MPVPSPQASNNNDIREAEPPEDAVPGRAQDLSLRGQETVGQIVDTPSALEFMHEALEKISEAELTALVAELRRKSQRFRQIFALETLSAFDEALFRSLLRSVFSTRRRVDETLAHIGAGEFRDAVGNLIHGTEPLVERFDTFVERLEPIDLPVRCDLAGECLHYWDFERYWLWTRWIWDPARRTGSLPLVTIQEYDLYGETPGSTYMKVGEAIAYVNSVGEAAGFQHGGRGLLGTDVYLACVYTVYLYTVTRMRMTKEFTKVIPQFPELIRRLLGTYKMEV